MGIGLAEGVGEMKRYLMKKYAIGAGANFRGIDSLIKKDFEDNGEWRDRQHLYNRCEAAFNACSGMREYIRDAHKFS